MTATTRSTLWIHPKTLSWDLLFIQWMRCFPRRVRAGLEPHRPALMSHNMAGREDGADRATRQATPLQCERVVSRNNSGNCATLKRAGRPSAWPRLFKHGVSAVHIVLSTYPRLLHSPAMGKSWASAPASGSGSTSWRHRPRSPGCLPSRRPAPPRRRRSSSPAAARRTNCRHSNRRRRRPSSRRIQCMR